jgi:nuclear pore complex protein Nup155
VTGRAKSSQLELEQRSFYLAQALTSARSAERITAEDVDFVNTVQERMDVSQVQLEVVRAIREHVNMTEEEKAEVLANLVTRLVPLDSVSLGGPGDATCMS